MLNRRQLLGIAGPLSVAGAVGIQIQPKARPEKIETEQVYLTKDGHKRVIGDQWHTGEWAVCGPRRPHGVTRKTDFWVMDLAWPIEIQTWTYLDTLSDLSGGQR